MYLHTVQHDPKEHDIDSILAVQTGAWIYESHCWIDDPEVDHKKCMWCGHKSTKDMEEDEAPDKVPMMCKDNPVIKSILGALKPEGIDGQG